MDNQEEFMTPSRAEYIRLARDSCTRNLGSNNSDKNYNSDKELQKEQKMTLTAQSHGETYEEYQFLAQRKATSTNYNVKSLLVRIICCALLFLSIFIIDKFDITIKNLNSDTLKECISSSDGVEEAQDFFVSLYEKVVKK